ncbi:hypothetical protein GCM10011588_25310 [Nocardia jinanensis]|uniref:Uncharacterized protein n=2 Tax=Nocardia jinanensis TaxID=382504 RepID=A0A917VQX9_9NOCA|nr:hypothetical protein GCM10011588_25310 [Nocardia jinanensis]
MESTMTSALSSVEKLLPGTDEMVGWLGEVFERIDWAEEEIQAAQKRHPGQAAWVWHGFSLLQPTHQRVEHELLFRAHCREILDRIAASKPTQPGTAAEVWAALSEAPMRAPLNTESVGLYFRMWQAAGLPPLEDNAGQLENYEAIAGSRIDDLEAESRRRLTALDRRFGAITCEGRHHGEPVECEFALAAIDAA